ncbi:toprim domain-containing protein, partial [Aquimarina agarivorans]|uniref:toprim domain-containing protein n=1 Tax=Aquimarina agarivorans TaxID=980584 RepID=UPI000248EB89
YPSYPALTAQHLVLTESIIDAATLQQYANLPQSTSVLACYGTNGFTQEHAEAASQLPEIREIIIFFDGDTAGRKAAKKLADQLKQQLPKVIIRVIDTPEGEDINSLWTNNEDASIFETLLKEARPTIESINIPELNIIASKVVTPIQKSITKTSNEEKESFPQLGETEKGASQLLLKVKGQVKNTGDTLKVTLQTTAPLTKEMLIQKLDLYDYTNLEKHAKVASKTLDIDTGEILKEWQIFALSLEKQTASKKEEKQYILDQATKNRCLEFLRSDNLLQRINEAIGQTGIVGESDNRLLIFLIATSYYSDSPLHGLIQGSSGSGKTKLLQSIYKLLPKETFKSFTRVTESSFYNYAEYALCHKLLCFEDLDGLEEKALLALRELQSSGKLDSSTAQKLESGRITSGENSVKGPIASLACTTKADVYEDNISRCFVIAVDESARQTADIINYQNQVAAGLIDLNQIQKTRVFIQNCTRVLLPLQVVNPFATKIQLPQNIHKLR